MRTIGIAAALLASPAFADGDTFQLELVTPGFGVVTYHNSGSRMSAQFPREMTDGDLTVGVWLTITSADEIIEITPPPGWVADPPRLNVADGDTGYIEVRLEQEWQGM